MHISGTCEGGNPQFEVEIESEAASSRCGSYTAILDTGFNGYLCVPLVVAVDLGMTRESTVDLTLADGKTAEFYTAECMVSIRDKETEGIAYFNEDCVDILLGTEFLRKCRLKLVVDMAAKTCELTDEKCCET